VYSTCPQSNNWPSDRFLARIVAVSRWSDAAGCKGMLVYTDNGLVDPWLLAQAILQSTERLEPLVAVQPVYMHPYAAAKMVATLGLLTGRRIAINMVSGGFRNDLLALNDDTEHDDRYTRLTEYALIIKSLLRSDEPVTFSGDYYCVKNLTLKPSLPPELFPDFTVSGSSPAGLEAARAIGATAVKYPRRVDEEIELAQADGVPVGMRAGIIARETSEQAWSAAHEQFPPDRKGQITHKLAMAISDSHWHNQLSELGAEPPSEEHPYWLHPFENYKTFCPYLVGSYARVADELASYMARGFRTFILDIPQSQAELQHASQAFVQAGALVRG
jgi:alkanesulfonate monooxygenase